MAKEVKTIGVLTSGGDAPGMNAAIRAVVRTGNYKRFECKRNQAWLRRTFTGRDHRYDMHRMFPISSSVEEPFCRQQDVWISQHRKDSKKVRRSVKNMELTVL